MDNLLDSVPIEGFWDYHITRDGEVINTKTNRVMTLSLNQNGDPTVGMVVDGYQYRRSVKVLVARAFVEGENEIFNTPVQLDGNKYNLRAENIVWRPRWFAWKYTKQFDEPYPLWYSQGPIIDIVNRLRYRTVLDASVLNGVLCSDIRLSMLDERKVFPTGQIFVYV